MSKPLPWSFSSLNKFATCPMQYYETRVLGNFKDEPGETAKWGTYVHKCIEVMIESGLEMPENTLVYLPQVREAIGSPENTKAEVQLAINSGLEATPWETRWAGSISDVLKVQDDVARVVDWKLGKIKPSNQLKLNALMVFYNYPEVQTCYTSFEWLQFKTRTEASYIRDQMPELWDVFMPNLRQYVQAFKTDTWQCRPSGLCRGWCSIESCQHWMPKK